jgi:glucose-6-phosphate dehydrogenase assembly protein OpcA
MSAAGTVQPESILKELAGLWVSLAKEKEGEQAGTGVLRAISMTLIAAVDEEEDPAEVGETVAMLMREHPSRAITLRMVAEAGHVLSSRVYAQCWMPFGQRRQICCEQIEITASDAALEDLSSVVLPLAVPDLPVILWCRGTRLFNLPHFIELAAVATKVILHGDDAESPRAALDRIHAITMSGRLVADLAWTQITRWRELISRVLENLALFSQLNGEVQVIVYHGGPRPRIGTHYLAAWLANSLESCGATVKLTIKKDADGSGLGGVQAVSICAGKAVDLFLQAQGGGVEIIANGQVSHSTFPAPTDYSLLQEELSVPARDPIFEAALARTARII